MTSILLSEICPIELPNTVNQYNKGRLKSNTIFIYIFCTESNGKELNIDMKTKLRSSVLERLLAHRYLMNLHTKIEYPIWQIISKNADLKVTHC